MKKLLTYCVLSLTTLSLAACGQSTITPEVPENPTINAEQSVENTNSPIVSKPIANSHVEIIIKEEVSEEPKIVGDMTGSELRHFYANFMRDYDWSQHNGFTSETSGTNFVYIFTDNGFIQEVKRESEVYEDTYVSQHMVSYTDSQYQEFLMYDQDYFSTTTELAEVPVHPTYWHFYNEDTKAEFIRSKTTDKIYDIISFETTWASAEDVTTEPTIRGYLYVDRETQKAAYMEDLDRGTIVHFLTNATYTFTMPTDIKIGLPETTTDITYLLQDYIADVNRYLTTE